MDDTHLDLLPAEMWRNIMDKSSPFQILKWMMCNHWFYSMGQRDSRLRWVNKHQPLGQMLKDRIRDRVMKLSGILDVDVFDGLPQGRCPRDGDRWTTPQCTRCYGDKIGTCYRQALYLQLRSYWLPKAVQECDQWNWGFFHFDQ